jgi:2-polyprenyl-3-methyl-5-hydroxy-6-metoxy-1,4-benzoquinol methylase
MELSPALKEAVPSKEEAVLDNIVNRHDIGRVARKLSSGQLSRILNKVRIRGMDRVVANWSGVDPTLQEWWAIPEIIRRWNTFASGDPAISFPQHVADTWLAGKSGLRALSLGCGTGGNEIIWAKLGVFSEIIGIDISPNRIDHANRQAKEVGLDSVLTFRAADARQLLREAEQYDVVLGLQSLHHFDNLDATMDLIARLLGPGGLLIFDEFVGPTKFQWTPGQLQAANSLLESLPPELRVQQDGRVKRRVVRPSLLSMRMDDPSEAVEAGNLLPALRRRFDVLEERPYGGTVLHLALSGIAQNFLDGSPATSEWIEKCFMAEDEALPQLGHDFVFAVCKPKAA